MSFPLGNAGIRSRRGCSSFDSVSNRYNHHLVDRGITHKPTSPAQAQHKPSTSPGTSPEETNSFTDIKKSIIFYFSFLFKNSKLYSGLVPGLVLGLCWACAGLVGLCLLALLPLDVQLPRLDRILAPCLVFSIGKRRNTVPARLLSLSLCVKPLQSSSGTS